MKHCKNCGTKLKDDAIYCYACGTMYDESQPETDYAKQREDYRRQVLLEEKNQRRRSRGRLLLFLFFFIVGAGIFFTLWYSSALRVFREVRAGNTQQAEAIYHSSVEGNLFESFLVRSFAAATADQVLADYNDGKASYEDAYREMQLLLKMEFPINDVEQRAATLDLLKLSKDAYTEGVSAENAGDYASAMTAYAKVIEEDRHYREAAEKAQNMATMYKESILESVASPENAADYEAAIEVLTAAQKLLPKDQDFSERLTTLRQNYASMIKTQAVTKAKEYTDKGYYKQAIAILKEALSYSQNDMQLQTMLTTATTDYENFVKEQVQIYLENRDWKGAMALLERVKKELVDDAVIDQLYVTTKASEALYQ